MTIDVRALRPDDHDAVLAFLRGLSAETMYKRFFSLPRVDDRLYDMVAHPSECCSEALLALEGDEIVGLASFDRLESDPTAADRAAGRGRNPHFPPCGGGEQNPARPRCLYCARCPPKPSPPTVWTSRRPRCDGSCTC